LSNLARIRSGGIALQSFQKCVLVSLFAGTVGTFCTQAHAQVISQYFPSDLPGYGTSQNDSVFNRRLFESMHSGIPVDGFIVRPSLSQTAGWSSTVLGTPGSASEDVDTSASLRLNSNWGRNSVGMSAGVLRREYPELSAASYTNWNASGGASATLGEGVLSGGYSHSIMHLGATDLGNFGVSYPVPYTTDDYRLSMQQPLGRFAIIPSFSYDNYQFGAAPAGAQRDFGSLSHRLFTETLSTRYEISQGNALVFIGRGSQAQFSDIASVANGYVDAGGFFGIDLRADPVLQYRLLAGGETRHFKGEGSQSVTTPTLEADVNWMPTRLNTFMLTARRGIYDPTSPFARNQIVTDVRLEAAHELRQDITLSGFGESAFTDANYAGQTAGKRRQTQFKFGLAATWFINRYLTASLTYSHVTSYTKGGAPILPIDDFGFSRATFTANSVSFSISLAQ